MGRSVSVLGFFHDFSLGWSVSPCEQGDAQVSRIVHNASLATVQIDKNALKLRHFLLFPSEFVWHQSCSLHLHGFRFGRCSH